MKKLIKSLQRQKTQFLKHFNHYTDVHAAHNDR